MRVLVSLGLLLALIALGFLTFRSFSGVPDMSGERRSARVEDVREPDPALIAPAQSVQGEAPARESVPGIESADLSASEESAELDRGGLRVRVIDANGQPVGGILVTLSLRMAGTSGGNSFGQARSRSSDGVARIGLEEFVKDERRLEFLMKMQPTFVVTADLASPRPVALELEGKPSDGQEVQLVLPPRGAALVRVTDEHGAPLMADGSVYAWWTTPEEHERAPDDSGQRISDHPVPIENGVARLENVGLGLLLMFSAHAPGHQGDYSQWIKGPTAAGQEVQAALQIGPKNPIVRFRVIDTDGAPLADTKVAVATHMGDHERGKRPPKTHFRRLHTDAEGFAVYETSAGPRDRQYEFDVEVRENSRSLEPGEDWCVATLQTPTAANFGEVVDVGVARLAPVPTLLQGLVVDQDGAPVPRVNLRFQYAWGDKWSERKNFGQGQTSTDNQGRFTLRGRRPIPRLGVSISAKGYESFYDSDLPVGARNVVLQLQREAPEDQPVHGKLALDLQGEAGSAFLLRLGLYWRREGGRQSSTECPPLGLGEYSMPGFEPGVYSFWVRARDGGWDVARVEGIEVRANETTRDHRLLPLDLTGRFKTVQLKLVHESGTPYGKVQPRITPAGGESFFRRTSGDGELMFVVPPGTVRLTLTFDGETTVDVNLDDGTTPQKVVIPSK